MPPILLLKTKSSPQDGYEEFFTEKNYTPTFVPVLEHRFHTQNLSKVRDLFNSGAFTAEPSATTHGSNANPSPKKYGGLIFTSQRAVEGFAQMIEEGVSIPTTPLTLYTVGPATARTLQTLVSVHLPRATIYGAESGTGENLAHLILEHYNSLYPDTGIDQYEYGVNKPSLLFLVGEVRRDIIPRTLMDPAIGGRRVAVEEVVVYETGVMGGFEGEFGGLMNVYNKELDEDMGTKGEGVVWVVVFSPTGCEAMLRVLGVGPFASETGTGTGDAGAGGRVFVATIGPTTRDYLKEKFGFDAHVCAARPSPQGVLEGIERFMGV